MIDFQLTQQSHNIKRSFKYLLKTKESLNKKISLFSLLTFLIFNVVVVGSEKLSTQYQYLSKEI